MWWPLFAPLGLSKWMVGVFQASDGTGDKVCQMIQMWSTRRPLLKITIGYNWCNRCWRVAARQVNSALVFARFGAGGTVTLISGHISTSLKCAFVLQATSTLNSWQLWQKPRSFADFLFCGFLQTPRGYFFAHDRRALCCRSRPEGMPDLDILQFPSRRLWKCLLSLRVQGIHSSSKGTLMKSWRRLYHRYDMIWWYHGVNVIAVPESNHSQLADHWSSPNSTERPSWRGSKQWQLTRAGPAEGRGQLRLGICRLGSLRFPPNSHLAWKTFRAETYIQKHNWVAGRIGEELFASLSIGFRTSAIFKLNVSGGCNQDFSKLLPWSCLEASNCVTCMNNVISCYLPGLGCFFLVLLFWPWWLGLWNSQVSVRTDLRERTRDGITVTGFDAVINPKDLPAGASGD